LSGTGDGILPSPFLPFATLIESDQPGRRMLSLETMKDRFLLATTALALTVLIASASSSGAASDAGIRVVVKGLRTNDGRVGCALFNGPDGFPRHRTKAYRHMVAEKHDNVGVCDFTGVPAGTYAVTILDDTNMNGKMDFNMIGLPKKGYGFSNDAKATLSPPSFSAASFTYSGTGTLEVPINTVYRTN
jgi:uncharacterized protein (DUF2141 family)